MREIQMQINAGAQGQMGQFIFIFSKLSTMMEWELLLVEVASLLSNWPASAKTVNTIIPRCKDCLTAFQNHATDVNPRSEIVEMAIIALINLGEYSFATNFDKNLTQQRWPFVEFLALFAKVAQDLADRKEMSSSYRELWSCGKYTLSLVTNFAKKQLGLIFF